MPKCVMSVIETWTINWTRKYEDLHGKFSFLQSFHLKDIITNFDNN